MIIPAPEKLSMILCMALCVREVRGRDLKPLLSLGTDLSMQKGCFSDGHKCINSWLGKQELGTCVC